MRKSIRNIIMIWLAWAIILLSFQTIVDMRFDPKLPDNVLMWTASETTTSAHRNRPYLRGQTMNRQVAFDSEYYLAIAVGGYDDPDIMVAQIEESDEAYSLSYAFFPVYPTAMRITSYPLRWLGMDPLGAVTVTGVLISLLGTLAAMLALYDIVRKELGEDGAIRAAFYMLIFPSGFFLAQVYTEGLFIGLAFSSMALIRHREWSLAALLAALATGTRAAGGLLLIPLAIAWYQDVRKDGTFHIDRYVIIKGLLVLAPLYAYILWRMAFGHQFEFVEQHWFGRQLFAFQESWGAWSYGLGTMADNNQAVVYYALELAGVGFAVVASLMTIRRYPGFSLFGLGIIFLTITSGWSAQSMIRYVVTAPSIYVVLSRWGKHPAFDRAWSLASTLLMGMLATLYTFNMWVG